MIKRKETREFSRVQIGIEAEITSGELTIVSSETKNLSLSGAYVISENFLPRGRECQVTFSLGEGKGRERVEVKGRVVRVDDIGMAIEFLQIDIEGYHHLQNLIRFNAADPDGVEKEFREHRGIKRNQNP